MRVKKKAKLSSLAEAAATAWEHYRNYHESAENPETEEGDMDELEELLRTVLKPHMDSKEIQPLKSLKDIASSISIPSLLPVLISVSYCHLADVAIGDCLEHQQLQQQLEAAAALR